MNKLVKTENYIAMVRKYNITRAAHHQYLIEQMMMNSKVAVANMTEKQNNAFDEFVEFRLRRCDSSNVITNEDVLTFELLNQQFLEEFVAVLFA